IQDHLYVSLFGAIQQASAEALTGDQSAVQRLVATYESRRDSFVKAIHDIGWEVDAPKGTFFAWLPVPSGYSSETFADLLLEKAYVGTDPLNGFNATGDEYVRVSLLESEERLVEAVKRIGALDLF